MERTFKKTAVIGAGAWGTALAFTAAQDGSEVVLWTYLEKEAAAIRETRMSLVPIKGARPLPENVKVTSDWADVAGAELVIVVVPSVVMRSVAQSLANVGLAEHAVIVSCSKGIEKDTNLLMSEILASNLNYPVGALSGPNHAEDIVQGLPSLTASIVQDCITAARNCPGKPGIIQKTKGIDPHDHVQEERRLHSGRADCRHRNPGHPG